jgi:phospho-N-acetylmuramoyl-pentapeptide-transferase
MPQSLVILELAKILTYSALSFMIGLWFGPYLIKFLVWLKFWKKKPRTAASSGEDLVITKKFYEENEKGRLIPRGGGILIWLVTILFALVFYVILKIDPDSKTTQFLNFITRKQTFIPFATMFFGALFGLIDDALSTLESGGNYFAGGLKLRQRLILVGVLSLGIGAWFYFRLGIKQISFFNYQIMFDNLPFGVNLPWLIIPIAFVVLVGLFGTSVIDGLDGLFAGVFIPIYLCFAGLAFAKEYYDISTFMMVIVGAMTAYLWYNISPAKFFMGDTGSLALVLTLGSVAILIDKVYILPLVAIMPILTALSNVIQLLSKKFLKRKVFLAAPLHHHLEAIGWTRSQIVFRYCTVTLFCSILGLVLGLLFR